MTMFMLSSHQGGFCINERSNNVNHLEVLDGELSETQLRAMAYKMLAMLEGDKVR